MEMSEESESTVYAKHLNAFVLDSFSEAAALMLVMSLI